MRIEASEATRIFQKAISGYRNRSIRITPRSEHAAVGFRAIRDICGGCPNLRIFSSWDKRQINLECLERLNPLAITRNTELDGRAPCRY